MTFNYKFTTYIEKSPIPRVLVLLLAFASPLNGQLAKAYMADAVTGPAVPPKGEGPDARQTLLLFPVAVAVDSAANVFIVDERLNRVLKVTSTGAYSLAAGSGAYGVANTDLAGPEDIAIDRQNNLYIADQYRSRIVRVSSSGAFTVLAGGGPAANTADGFPGPETRLQNPERIAVDLQGNVYWYEDRKYKIRRLSPGGRVEPFAGTGVNDSPDSSGPARSTPIGDVNGMTFDPQGTMYFVDRAGDKVKKITSDGMMSLVISAASIPWKSGAKPAFYTASFRGIAVDAQGTLFLGGEYGNTSVLRCPAQRDCEVFAGGGGTSAMPIVPGFSGDGPLGTQRKLGELRGITLDPQGNLYLTEDHRVRKISAGQISTIAGSASPEAFQGVGDARSLISEIASGFVSDRQGNLYFSDGLNARVWKITSAGRSSAFAGTGTKGFSGDGGPATQAELNTPGSLAIDAQGNVFISDSFNNVVRKVDTNGRISTVAGSFWGLQPPCDLNASSVSSAFSICTYSLTAIAIDNQSQLLLVSGSKLWRVTADGSARTLPSPVTYIGALAVDRKGNLYASSTTGDSLWRAGPGGTDWTRIAGSGAAGFSGDGGPALEARIGVRSIAVDDKDYIFIGNGGNPGRLRVISPSGMISSLTGTTRSGVAAIGGPASDLRISPAGIAFGANGVLFLSEGSSSSNVTTDIRIWSLEPAQIFRSAILNAASFIGGAIAPGEMVTLFGLDIGPSSLALYEVQNGQFSNHVAQTRVLFNGIAAPIIYASSGAVSVVVPYGISDRSEAEVWVEFQGRLTNKVKLPVLPTFPGIFTIPATGTGQVALQHWPDYSINHVANPIARNGVGMLYLTSGGDQGQDGRLVEAIQNLSLPVQLTVGGILAQVSYAGPAPGLIYGMMQINFVVPADVTPGEKVPIQLRIGDRPAQPGLTLAIQ